MTRPSVLRVPEECAMSNFEQILVFLDCLSNDLGALTFGVFRTMPMGRTIPAPMLITKYMFDGGRAPSSASYWRPSAPH
jgi:hypothetical protein